jgi:hypothetical protein
MDLTDEGVDVDHQPRLARPGARAPRALEGLRQHPVELTDMPERERPQKRAQRRRRHRPVTEHHLGAPGPEHVAVIDAVRPEQHRVDQREHLAPRPRRPRPTAEPDRRIDERLEPQPPPQRHREHDPGVDDHPLVIEDNLGSVRQIVHHAGDLLTQTAAARYSRFSPAQEVISLPHPDRSPPQQRWIEA